MKIREILDIFEKLKMEVREGRDTIAKFRYDGKVVIRTRVPHKRGELQGKLVYFIRQQMRLNENQFKKLSDCTLYREDYEEILKNKGYINHQ